MSKPRSIMVPPGVTRGQVKLSGGPPPGQLAVLETGPAGNGRLPLVFVPGFTGSKEDFLPLLPLVAEQGHAALAIDLPGQYQSPGPDDPEAYTIPALAATVRALVDTLPSGPPVHLIGHSFGGLVCRRLVIEDATGIASLTLLGSGPGALDGQRAAALAQLRPVIENGGVAAVWAVTQELAAKDSHYGDLSDDVKEFLRRRFFASHQLGLQVMAEQLVSAPDEVDQLAATGRPVLVAHGEGDDAWSPATQAEMATRLAAAYAVVPGALHSPAVESPHATAEALTRFWADVEGRS